MHRRHGVLVSGISSRGLLLTTAALMAFVASARADVTIQEKTVSSGLAGFGSGTSERTLVIAGDKCRTDDSYTYTGRFKTFAGGGKPRVSAQIVRLDRDLIWSLEMDKKQYTELTFAEMREMMDKGLAQAQAEMDKPENRDAKNKVDVDFKVDAKRTGKHEKVNGFEADEYVVTLTAIPKDKSTGESAGLYSMTMDQWMSTQVPGQSEIQAYYKRFAEKMGMDPQFQAMARGMMSQYRGGLKELAEKLKDMKGYPVRSTLTMQMGATLTPEQQAKMDKARAEQRKSQAEEKKKQDEKDEAEANGNAAGNLAHGNVGGALGGLLGHKFGKAAEKKAESSMASGAGNEGAPGGGLSVTTDVIRVTTGAAPASFDVPSDFKKVERKDREHK